MNLDGATLTSEERDTHVLIGLSGEVDVFNAARIVGLVESAIPTQAQGAILDLCAVGFLDSTAIRKLFALVNRLAERRQRVLVVVDADSTVRRTLELVDFARAAPMLDSLEEATELLAQPC